MLSKQTTHRQRHAQEKRTPLMVAAANDNLEAVEALLEHGADVNAVDAVSGVTPAI